MVSCAFDVVMVSCFRGQEPLRKEYEVFKFCQIDAGQRVLGDYREIFTPGTNSWRRMDASLPVDITSTNARVIFMENLHVLAEHYTGHSRSRELCIYWCSIFDLEDENFRSIQVPDGISTEDGSVHIFRYLSGWNAITFKKLIQVNSYLALIDYKDLLIHNEMKLRILKDCQNQIWIGEIIYL